MELQTHDTQKNLTHNTEHLTLPQTDYLAYGEELTEPLQDNNGTILNNIGFTGHEHDYGTGFINMQARLQNPETGKFLTVDPGYDYDQNDPMSFNLYAYVRCNPIGRTDPTGMEEKKKVVVDPGHGDQPGKWNDGGAQSADKKTTEKDVVLIVSNAIVDELKTNNIDVIATRTGDVTHENSQPKLEWRTKIANDANADIFISIHADSQPKNTEASGMTVHYKSKEGKKIAQKILDAQKTMPTRKINKNNSLRVLNKTKMPAVLVEIGFLSNQSDLTKIQSESNLKSIGKEIATGIINYFNEKKK